MSEVATKSYYFTTHDGCVTFVSGGERTGSEWSHITTHDYFVLGCVSASGQRRASE